MSKKENQEKFESFKAEVLKWRNEHLLECKMFEKRMYENDVHHYLTYIRTL